MKNLSKNIENKNFKLTNLKFFLFNITIRRNFIPLLSIFFLSLPDTTINQIGLFTSIGYIMTIIFEVPSGYISDVFGHKKTLIVSKAFQVLSVLGYILGYFAPDNLIFYIFVIASALQSLGFSFFSGTKSAFYHELLEVESKEKEFAKYEGKLEANTSLASVFIIILLPFTTIINIVLPFVIWMLIDLIGLILLISIPNPNINHELEKKQKLPDLFIEAKNAGLISIAVFIGLIMGFFLGENAYRIPYLESLGYPIFLVGFVMGFSRVIWYFVGHHIYKLEKIISLKQLLLFELFLFPIGYLSMAYLNNPYIIGIVISIIIGYKWGSSSLVRSYLFKDYINNKKYKATFLSMASMLNSISGSIIAFSMGYFVTYYGYKPSYTILGLSLFVLLSISYYFTFIKKKNI